MGGHRKLEALPVTFGILTTIAILIGGLVEFIPLALVDENVPRISSVEPYTPLEVLGRDIYIREGCVGCHSQQVRPFRDEVERYGEYSKPGEHVYDHPFLWGSKRTGPDLHRVGGKYHDLWHVRHMENPRSTTPKSLMPPYPWLLSWELDVEAAPARLKALQRVGVPYSDEQIARAITDAQAQADEIAMGVAATGGPTALQDKEIVALVAYLQRLGTDLYR
jgi:cbb3-type cytochrome c oxidase subunit II